MNSFIDLVADPKVHDTVLLTMVITSFISAIRRIKVVTKWWHLLWNFGYDWLVGFWSMKTGQPLHTTETELKTSTDGSTKDVSLKTSSTDPTQPEKKAPE